MFRIATSLRVIDNSEYHERRDAISHDWVIFLEKHDIFPLFIPNRIKEIESYLKSFGPIDGILLTSGNDVGIKDSDDLAPERDFVEKRLVEYAEANSLPLLGVCRGLHFLNHFYGGTVVSLSSIQRGAVNHVNKNHHVELYRDKLELPNDWGKSVLVNSYHNNCVTLKNLSSHLIPFAVTEQGIVEGVKHKDLPFWAIQWHPEREKFTRKIDIWLINQLKK